MRVLIVPIMAAAAVSACDERLDPLSGGFRRPPIDVTAGATGDYSLVAVNDTLLPHDAVQAGPSPTTYSLVSGSFKLNADSSWEFSSVEVVKDKDGKSLGSSPANYQGKWTVADSTINVLSRGTAKVKGDTIFWRGGPKHTWEDTLKFTLVKK